MVGGSACQWVAMVVGSEVRIRWWVGRPMNGSTMGGWVSSGSGWVYGMRLLGLCFMFLFFCGGGFGVYCGGFGVRRWWHRMWGVDGC